eukprot:superscaffoldBa00000094_g1388
MGGCEGTYSQNPHKVVLILREQGTPVQYSAEYIHKLHIDLNKKLVMFWVTNVLSVDGFSSKNNLTIYQENHTVERMWPEVNNRVNYPVKGALIHLVDRKELNLEDNMTQCCLSTLTCQIAQIGLDWMVQTWNAHSSQGKGITSQLALGGCSKKLPADPLPEAAEAADCYDRETE